MLSEWQQKRRRIERQERNLRFAICLFIICAVLILQSIAHRDQKAKARERLAVQQQREEAAIVQARWESSARARAGVQP